MADLPNQFIRSNSTGGAAFDGISFRSQTPTTNPADKIDLKVGGEAVSQLQYPPDIGKYKFVIIESENVNLNQLSWERSYVLPFPLGLMEHYTTQYDHSFGYADEGMKALGSAANLLPGDAGNPVDLSGLGRVGAAALGVSLNQFKTVTLKNPDFNIHNFAWKLSPKTFEESQLIRNIIDGLRTGMAPTRVLGRAFFGFPKIYAMFFVPNMSYLYKFKPCVLKEIKVDYQGGHPAPAFYGGGQKSLFTADSNVLPRTAPGDFISKGINALNTATNSGFEVTNTPATNQNVTFGVQSAPPESVIVRTQWLELEQWTHESFKGGKMLNTDPFSTWEWYQQRGATIPFTGS